MIKHMRKPSLYVFEASKVNNPTFFSKFFAAWERALLMLSLPSCACATAIVVGEAVLVIHINAIAVLTLPLGHKIAAICAVTFNTAEGIGAVGAGVFRQEVTAAAAHGNINTVNVYMMVNNQIRTT